MISKQTTYACIVGAVLRTSRKLKGISLRAMSVYMGMEAGWHRVEMGITVANVDKLHRVAIKFNMSAHDFLVYADIMVGALQRKGIVVLDENPGPEVDVVRGNAILDHLMMEDADTVPIRCPDCRGTGLTLPNISRRAIERCALCNGLGHLTAPVQVQP